jgi:hypothetical protein
MSGQPTPSFPSRLDTLSDDVKIRDVQMVLEKQEIQEMVWATILSLAYLEKKLEDEKPSWELLAEKARDYLDEMLQNSGVDAAITQEVVRALITEALAFF